MLNFFKLLSTFVCPTEIVSFSDRVEEFRTIGCEIIGASTDSEFSHLAWYNYILTFFLNIDKFLILLKNLGLTHQESKVKYFILIIEISLISKKKKIFYLGGLGKMNIPILADKTKDISIRYGVLKEDEGIAFRGLFIIDDKGILRQITINDLPVGRSVDETLRLVQAFQFTDKHGEVCPGKVCFLFNFYLI